MVIRSLYAAVCASYCSKHLVVRFRSVEFVSAKANSMHASTCSCRLQHDLLMDMCGGDTSKYCLFATFNLHYSTLSKSHAKKDCADCACTHDMQII